ncbi:MAG: histidine phosphatase family protein [Acidimicrobiia bacterium]|nr:histidine phosphatase family protein [Acidimicrobiia bacterium]
MTLHVVRHGRTEANASGLLLGRADPALDDVGRRQATAIGRALPACSIVVTSPLSRCRETAELIAEHGQVDDIVVDDRLLEIDYGDLDLTPLREVPNTLWRDWQADTGFRPPGGETLEELGERVARCLDELWPRAVVDEVAVVTHVSPIKAALAWALGVSIAISWRCFVAQASITRIGSGTAGPSLHLFNDTTHLTELPS